MRLGVNFNGDIAIELLINKATQAESIGFDSIWIGEHRSFAHPFVLLGAISRETKSITIGTSIISAFSNRCFHILKSFSLLKEVYGSRFIAGIATGDFHSLRAECIHPAKPVKKVMSCVEVLKKTLPVYVGATAKKMIASASQLADGVILNHIHPEHISWALKQFRGDAVKAAIAPALLLPDEEHEKKLVYSAGVVAAGLPEKVAQEFGIEREFEKIREIVKKGRFEGLLKHRDFLLERFALAGDAEELVSRLEELKKLGIELVILGAPFFMGKGFNRADDIISR